MNRSAPVHQLRSRSYGYGDLFLLVDGWGTLRGDFDELESELQTLANAA